MLNKLLAFSREYDMITPSDHIICAVSGGADSIALLFALYLLRDKLGITLSAAHFNHHLRGAESDRDERFVRDFCAHYDIPLAVGSANVVSGEKGLEAAARDARYAFLRSLGGKIATAHTADDNAETLVMHLIRGTGLKGLGGITPVSGNVIRPMLAITRAEVEDFLSEWGLSHIEDSSNAGDAFLRNRVRHQIMPLLRNENPSIAENMSAMALRLRLDEEFIAQSAEAEVISVPTLRAMHISQRARALEQLLKAHGVREPEAAHIRLAEKLVFSDNPSAQASFPCGVTLTRCYDTLTALAPSAPLSLIPLPERGCIEFGDYVITCAPAQEIINTPDTFTIAPSSTLCVRTRLSGDAMRLHGGTKTLKKLFIDRKIPAATRACIPVIADADGVAAVYPIGVHLDRAALTLPALQIHIEKKE